MFDSRKQNPNCNYSDEIVSFIYDEMNSAERVDFEKHIIDCSNCAIEIEAFSSVSLSIQEWRDEEFANLKTPEIIIPYETPTVETIPVQNEIVTTSWSDKFRAFINFSPANLKTATLFGILVLTIGFAWLFIGISNEDNKPIAELEQETNEPPNKHIEANTESKTAKNLTLAKENKTLAGNKKESLSEQIVAVGNKRPQLKIDRNNKSNNRNKAKSNRKIYKANRQKNKAKSRKIESNLKPKKQDQIKEVPRLTDFAVEENQEEKGLRLTDYFEDDESGD